MFLTEIPLDGLALETIRSGFDHDQASPARIEQRAFHSFSGKLPFEMIHDLLTHWRSIPGLAAHPVWSASFQWLEHEAAAAAEGDHPLGSTGFLARVMSYPLKARDDARYESHRRTIDVQYTLEGGEAIEFSDPGILTRLNDYNETKEVEHYATPPEGQVRIANLAGRFTVILPGEPHMPQLSVTGCSAVRKVVIKIPAALVGL